MLHTNVYILHTVFRSELAVLVTMSLFFILIINQLDAQNLFYSKFISYG